MSEATVYSKIHTVDIEVSLTIEELEERLKNFLGSIGQTLSYKGKIMGHIKVLAKPLHEDSFVALSVTRLDVVDMKRSAVWGNAQCPKFTVLELNINVLIFGHSKSEVATVVDRSLSKLQAGLLA